MSLRERLEEAHISWVTDPDWMRVKEGSAHPDSLLACAAQEVGVFPEALGTYLKGLGYPSGPYTYVWGELK